MGPLLLSFDKKVAFHTKWKYLFKAMIFPAFFYIVWDIWFTQKGVWSFNDNYISGIKIYNLPLEEVLFFFVVPYCCVFIYECVNVYFPKLTDGKGSFRAFIFLMTGLWIMAFLNCQRQYTFYTFLFCGTAFGLVLVFNKKSKILHIKKFLISYAIVLIPFLLVNGLLTAIPVVIYNHQQNLNFRIYTIPVEDIIYGMLLIMMNIVIFERIRRSRKEA